MTWKPFIVKVCKRGFYSDVNHEMDVGLHGWVSTPPVQPVPNVHCPRKGFVFQVNFNFPLGLHAVGFD